MNHPPFRFDPSAPLQIGMFTDSYTPQVNGVAISLQLVVQGLRQAGHEVTVFAPRFPGYQDQEPKVYRIPSLKYMDVPPIYVAIPGTPRTTWSLHRCHFNVLHAHSPLTVGFLAYLTALFRSLPLIYTYHTSIADYTHHVKVVGETRVIRYAARWFSTASTNLGDQIVVPSSKFKRLLLSQNVRRPIQVIPNGIDLTCFHKTKPSKRFHARLGLNPESPLLVSVGRLDPEKNLDFLVEAFARIVRNFPNAHLVIAGDGSSRAHLEAKAAIAGVGHRIHFLGWLNRDEIPDLLHEGVLFLSVSTTEVHPLSMIEAIASGLPIVAIKDEAFEGLIVDGVNGDIVPESVEAFANAVCALLSDRIRLEYYGKKSVDISRRYSIERQVNALVDLYTQSNIQNQYSMI